MRLSRKKAIELCIELWTWLAKTGKRKSEWPRWMEFGYIDSECWFCHYDNHTTTGDARKQGGDCDYCPYNKKYGHCNKEGSFFYRWDEAQTPRTRKKYAKLFLKQIKTLK